MGFRGLVLLSLTSLVFVLVGSSTHAQLVDGGLYGLAPNSGPTKSTDVLLIDPTDASWTVVANYAGIEFHAFEIASDGTIYATGTWDGGGADTNLYTLDVVNDTYTTVGTFGTDLYFGGLSLANDGTLYGSGSDLVGNALYTLDKSTGAASSVGSLGFTTPGGIAGLSFNADGSVLSGVEGSNGLYTIDESTATPTSIGGSTNGLNALAINSADGILYGNVTSQVSGAETLVTISAIDGSTTTVGTMVVGTLTSLTFANLTSVPEPSCLMVAALLFGISATRRRRSV